MDYARTIGSAIAEQAALRADAPALIAFRSRTVSYADLHALVVGVAADLANAGIAGHDRVGLLVPPGVDGAQLVVALASNVVLVPMNPALTNREIEDARRASSLKAIVIPKWLNHPARAELLERPIAVLEAADAPDGRMRLEALSGAVRPVTQTPLDPPATALLLRSSGTVNAPKLIAVTHGNLLATADRLSSDLWFQLTANDRAACTLPLYYAAGIKTTLIVPLVLGASVAFPPVGRELHIADWIANLKPTFLSVSPTTLNAIVDRLKTSPGTPETSALRFVMCAAGYLAHSLGVEAASLLRAPVLEYYALSEAGPMAANPTPPRRIRPGTVGLPAPGQLKVVDEAGRQAPPGDVGEIVVRGPTVMPHDLHEGWLATGDLGRLDEDGYLTIVGRIKEVINRGGEKVFPYEVEKAILEHPAVLEAAAFGVPHPRLGESVAAAVTLKPSRAVSEEELKAFISGHLAAFKRPRRIWFVPSLPRGKTGKILRSTLRNVYPSRLAPLAQPDQLLEIELRDLWQRLLGTSDIGIDDDFLDKGGDSLLATEMLCAAEELVGKKYPHSELGTLTIRRMTQVFMSEFAADHEVITQAKRGAGLPLFFCHGDYLTRGIYAHKLAALLPDDHPVFLLHCPEESTRASVESIAEAYLPHVLRAAAGAPVFVAGYCNGGLAAWHLTHLLRDRGVDVVEMVLVETLSLNARRWFRALALLFRSVGVFPGRAANLLRKDGMRALWIQQRGFASSMTLLAAARNKLGARRAVMPPRDLDDAAARSYLRLMSHYVPPRIDVPVTCLIAEGGRQFDTDPRFWRGIAAMVRSITVPGTHLTVPVSERGALAVTLGEILRQGARRHREGARQQASGVPRPIAQAGASIQRSVEQD